MIEFKKGDSFQPALAVVINLTPQVITGWGIESKIRNSQGVVVAVLEVFNRSDSLGTYQLKPATGYAEADWPTGQLSWDIRYTTDTGVKFSTETMTIDCKKGIV
jgi:hypothetical protein